MAKSEIRLVKNTEAPFGYVIDGEGMIPASPYEVKLWEQYVRKLEQIRLLEEKVARYESERPAAMEKK